MPATELIPDDFPVLVDWPIQWGDQDLFGHVNNTVYFRWFETARVEYLNRLGIVRMHGHLDIGPILAHASCNFRKQLQFPDTVRLGTRVSRLGKTSMTLEHAVWSTTQNLALAAEGTSVVVTFDYRAQRTIEIPQQIRERIQNLEGQGQ